MNSLKKTKGTIFNIQHFSIDDGQGIRTTVFMKGCPLNCVWCHNPESKKSKKEVFFDCEKCVSCQNCVAFCKNNCHLFSEEGHFFDRKNCIACGECTQKCVNNALEVVGYEIEAGKVVEEVLKDAVFYKNSNGGITLSGGEPLLQWEFTYAILSLAKECSLHTCLETCGYADFLILEKIVPLVDVFLYDYKETDPVKHQRYTGVSNALIIENLQKLDSVGKKIILRCPIVPEFNDREEHFDGIAKIANQLKNVLEIHILPYHSLGESKAERLGKEYAVKVEQVSDSIVDRWVNAVAKKTGVPVKKI